MSGVISGSAGIIKTGKGQLNLTATDTYTGSTTISGGVLQANLGAGLPSSSYLVLDGGVLQNNSTSFTRSLGTAQNGSYFEWTGNGGGFSPSGSALTVNIGGSGATLVVGFDARHKHHGTFETRFPDGHRQRHVPKRTQSRRWNANHRSRRQLLHVFDRRHRRHRFADQNRNQYALRAGFLRQHVYRIDDDSRRLCRFEQILRICDTGRSDPWRQYVVHGQRDRQQSDLAQREV